MSKAITICLVIVGLINFLPVVGVLGVQRLESAYGVDLFSNELIILMRHRALLFGILGGFILYAAFVPSYQSAAMIMAAVSMIGFMLFSYSTGGYNQAINAVLIIDIVGVVFLVVAAALKYILKAAN